MTAALSPTVPSVPSAASPERRFEPGTTGWSAADLDIPEIEWLWEASNYEIIEGVLTRKPSNMIGGTGSLGNLTYLIYRHVDDAGMRVMILPEGDYILSERRIVRCAAVVMLPSDIANQETAAKRAGRRSMEESRLLVPPTLVIESISPGHEAHDRQTKRRYYAEAHVPHYWILDGYARTLECFKLAGDEFEQIALGRDDQTIAAEPFPDLNIDLKRVWV